MKLDKMTSIEWGVTGDKQILVPSFGTTGALFARHFDILNNLKRRILLLKQSHDDQRANELSTEQIEKIIKVLDKACNFLSFDDILKEVQDEKERKEKLYYEDITLKEEEEAQAKKEAEERRLKMLDDIEDME